MDASNAFNFNNIIWKTIGIAAEFTLLHGLIVGDWLVDLNQALLTPALHHFDLGWLLAPHEMH